MSFKKRVTSSFNSAVSKFLDTSPAITASCSICCSGVAFSFFALLHEIKLIEIAAIVSKLTKLLFIFFLF